MVLILDSVLASVLSSPLMYCTVYVRGELGDVIQVLNLSWCMILRLRREGIREGLVISQNMKGTAFQKVTEMLDGQVNCKELSIESKALYRVSTGFRFFEK